MIKIFYKVCDTQSDTIKAVYNNARQARQHANSNKNYFVAIGWSY